MANVEWRLMINDSCFFQGEVELRLAHPVDSSDNTVVPTIEQVTDKMLFKSSSIVCINIKDVDMEYASRGG